MALLSTKSTYGLLALFEISKHSPNEPITLQEIAQKTNIPKNYLDQLLPKLKKRGILKSIRGIYGGYAMGQKVSEVMLIDVLETLEDKISITSDKQIHPILQLFVFDIEKQLKEILRIPLQQLYKYESQFMQNLHYEI